MVIVLIFLSLMSLTHEFDSKFWYNGERPPEVKYDTVPYANLTVRIDKSYFEGPGEDLVTDPNITDSSELLYTGLTVNRQTFDTQFILDMQDALKLDTNRIYLLSVSPGKVHFSWETENVIVNFIFLERNNSQGNTTLLEAVAGLTNQIQDIKSPIYKGPVTKYISKQWGLVSFYISIHILFYLTLLSENDL
jgi:hypothetical protein